MSKKINNAVEIGKDVSWVGCVDEYVMFHSNPYMLVDGEEVVLFAPGSTYHINSVLDTILDRTDLPRIKYVVVSNQDPDLGGMIPLLEKKGCKFKIVTHTKNAILIAHEGTQSEFYIVDSNKWELSLESGRILKFIPTPFCPSAGSFMVYDEVSKTLFSGDLFGGLSPNVELFANDQYKDAMIAFHENFFPSQNVINKALTPLSKIDIKIIAPQHGKVIKENINEHIDFLRSLRSGIEHVDIFPDTKEGPAPLRIRRGTRKSAELQERETLKAKHIMSQDLTTVDENMTLGELTDLFVEKGLHGAPVVDKRDRLVGIITENDVIFQDREIHVSTAAYLLNSLIKVIVPMEKEKERFLVGGAPSEEELDKIMESTVKENMTKSVVTISEEATLEETCEIMYSRDVQILPVEEEGEIVGLVGKGEIVQGMATLLK